MLPLSIGLKDVEELVYEIDFLKTANYTIIGPLCSGLILAGGNKKQQKEIIEFGKKVGIAFQIQDDILGIFSDEIGKVRGSDIKENKQTLLTSYILNTQYKNDFLKIYGTEKLSTKKIEKVKKLLIQSGAKRFAEEKMNNYYPIKNYI